MRHFPIPYYVESIMYILGVKSVSSCMFFNICNNLFNVNMYNIALKQNTCAMH